MSASKSMPRNLNLSTPSEIFLKFCHKVFSLMKMKNDEAGLNAHLTATLNWIRLADLLKRKVAKADTLSIQRDMGDSSTQGIHG